MGKAGKECMAGVDMLALDAYISHKLGISYGTFQALPVKQRRQLEDDHLKAFKKRARQYGK